MSLTPEDSPINEEHDWDSYLIETNSKAAPVGNFKQSFTPPENDFIIGDKLESIDPRNRDSWCIGTIIDKDGPRLRIRLDGTDDRNDFWRLVDSVDIRCYGTTRKLGEQIAPPLGFQQNSTRWTKYFEKHIQNGPFADPSCFKPEPNKPPKNLFQVGQKLEAVDPKHPQLICPATVQNLLPGDYGMILSLDGWSSSNNFKVDYTSREIFPVHWCKLAGIRLAKVGGSSPSRVSSKTLVLTHTKQNGTPRQSKNNKTVITQDSSILNAKPLSTEDDSQFNDTKPIVVTVYWNYTGDNSGMLLNPQRFHSLMPSIFGPNDCHTVLKSIFDSCIKCSFQPGLFINRILDLFLPSNEKNRYLPSTHIKLENETIVNVPSIESEKDFWEIICTLQNSILAGNDLFIPTPPIYSVEKQYKKGHLTLINSNIKRKSTESSSAKIFFTNSKRQRSYSGEKSAYDRSKNGKTLNYRPLNYVQIEGVSSRDPERFTPSDVAAFVRKIDPSFNNLASRFLQEEIDGKALLLLTTDTLMRHMGLKLGPSLKIIDQIEKLKK